MICKETEDEYGRPLYSRKFRHLKTSKSRSQRRVNGDHNALPHDSIMLKKHQKVFFRKC